MIKSKEDYEYYLEADRLGMLKPKKIPSIFGEEVWKFVRVLRKVEYHVNCKKGLLNKLILAKSKYRLHQLGIKLGFSIPINVFGPGLAIFHYGTITVNPNAKVGKDCQIYTCTNIADGVVIGDKVFIAPGAKIINGVHIADGIRIGSNALVNESFLEVNITIAGVPAKKISDKGSNDHYIGGTEKLTSSSPVGQD